MDRTVLVDRVKEIAEPMLRSLGLELVEVEYAGSARSGTLRVFIDKQGGVTLDDCEKVSRYLSQALDVDDPIPHHYTFEVSSPGLDRPLKKRDDFSRSIGKKVKVKTSAPIENQKVFTGRLADFKEEKVTLYLEEGKGKAIEIPFDQITQARLEVEF